MSESVGRPPLGLTVSWPVLLRVLLAMSVGTGSIAFIEPSPYDVLLLVLLCAWFLGGFTVHPAVVPLAALIFTYNLGGFFALIPFYGDTAPTTFMLQSIYLATSCILLALFFAEDTLARLEIMLKAYVVSCAVAALGAIAGYFNIGGHADQLTLYGRASSFFKDPNVLGTYLVLGALYTLQLLMFGRTKRTVPTLMTLALILFGIFLSFSRGSWGVLVGSATLMVGFGLLGEGDPRQRRRVIRAMLVAVGIAVVGLVALLSIDNVRDMLGQRVALVQDYDGGETGRFGNQLNAIPMLLDRVNGFGPVRFRLFFDEDSHSSYVGSFSSYGWLGGASFILLVGLTMVIGFRLVLKPSPFQRLAQVIFPCLFAVMLQAFQIDIDHWRHFYLMLAAVWGLEAARAKWQRSRDRAFAATDKDCIGLETKALPAT